ncbi:PAS domain-containing sensor histidine kinase [Methylobacterium sp. P31]
MNESLARHLRSRIAAALAASSPGPDRPPVEVALRASESRYRALLRASNQVFYRHNADWSEMRQLSGGGFLADTQSPDPNWFDAYIHPDDQPHVWAVIQEAIRTRSVFELEHRVIRADGTLGWTLSRSVPVFDERGAIVEWFGAASDITARKDAERALRESEAKLARILDQVPIGVGLFDNDGRFVLKNTRLQALMGDILPSRETRPSPAWEGTDAQGRRLAPQDYPGARALRGEDATEPTIFRRIDAEGERWLRVSAVPQHQGESVLGGIAVVQDVTNELRAQTDLRVLAQRNSEILESISDAFYAVDRDWRFTYVNHRAEEWWKRSREDLIGRVCWEEFPQAIGSEAHRAHLQAAETRAPVGLEVLSPVLNRWLDVSIYPTADGGLSVYFRDISNKRRSEAALRESEERLRTLMQGIPQLVWRADNEGRWTWSSPQWQAFTGQSNEDSLGDGWLDAIHPDDREAARAAWASTIGGSSLAMETRVYDQAGKSYRWFATRASAVRDETGGIREWLGTSTDIHDLRLYQERQRVLVAELQHRTRNLMGVVRSITNKTLARSTDLADFEARFGARLAALARVQSLLSRLEEWDRVSFDELLRSELSAVACEAERISLEGPEGIALRSSTVQTFAMALHELVTNALKHGAFAQPEGRLSVRWHVAPADPDGRPWLHVDWIESGVPMPAADAAARQSGSGRELIERALPYQLGARTHYVMTADGIRCTIALPTSECQGSREGNVA